MGQFTRSWEGDREREEEMGNLLGLGRGTGRGRRKWGNLLGLGRRKWRNLFNFAELNTHK